MQVQFFHTGGTIGGVMNDPTNPSDYQGGSASIESMQTLFEEASRGLDVNIGLVTPQNNKFIDSKDLDPETMITYAQSIKNILQDESIDAVVVTHGTDSMERSAFFTQLALTPNKPVIFTGAMRPQGASGFDGDDNLNSVFNLLKQPEVHRSGGVFIVMGGKYSPAFLAKKENSLSRDYLGHSAIGCLTSTEATPLPHLFEQLQYPRCSDQMLSNYSNLKGSILFLHSHTHLNELTHLTDRDVIGLLASHDLNINTLQSLENAIQKQETLFLVKGDIEIQGNNVINIGHLSMEKGLVLAKTALAGYHTNKEEALSQLKQSVAWFNQTIEACSDYQSTILHNLTIDRPGDRTPEANLVTPSFDIQALTSSLDAVSKIKTLICHDGSLPTEIPQTPDQYKVLILRCPGNISIPDNYVEPLQAYERAGGVVVLTTAVETPVVRRAPHHYNFILNNHFKYDNLFSVVQHHINENQEISRSVLKNSIEYHAP